MDSNVDKPVEDDSSDIVDDVHDETCSYDSDPDWSCAIDEDASELSEDEIDEAEMQGRNHIRYVKVLLNSLAYDNTFLLIVLMKQVMLTRSQSSWFFIQCCSISSPCSASNVESILLQWKLSRREQW